VSVTVAGSGRLSYATELLASVLWLPLAATGEVPAVTPLHIVTPALGGVVAMVAQSGDRLLTERGVAAVREDLLPQGCARCVEPRGALPARRARL
jgi:hypothetical protein